MVSLILHRHLLIRIVFLTYVTPNARLMLQNLLLINNHDQNIFLIFLVVISHAFLMLNLHYYPIARMEKLSPEFVSVNLLAATKKSLPTTRRTFSKGYSSSTIHPANFMRFLSLKTKSFAGHYYDFMKTVD